jgi:hypothetical protein
MKNILLTIFSLFLVISVSAQITTNTNFKPNISEPLDLRKKPIATLADTSTITFPYEDLKVWVSDLEVIYRYDGTQWLEFVSGIKAGETIFYIQEPDTTYTINVLDTIAFDFSGAIGPTDTLFTFNSDPVVQGDSITSPTEADISSIVGDTATVLRSYTDQAEQDAKDYADAIPETDPVFQAESPNLVRNVDIAILDTTISSDGTDLSAVTLETLFNSYQEIRIDAQLEVGAGSDFIISLVNADSVRQKKLFISGIDLDEDDEEHIIITGIQGNPNYILQTGESIYLQSQLVDGAYEWVFINQGKTETEIRNIVSDSIKTFPTLSAFVNTTKTYSVGDRIYIEDTGAEYLVQADSVAGYVVDSVAVVPVGSNYAVIQEVAGKLDLTTLLSGDYQDGTFSINAGTNTFTTSIDLSIEDIGKSIVIYNAGGTGSSLGDELIATIETVTGINSGTVSISATNTVSSIKGFIGTNNSPLFQKIINTKNWNVLSLNDTLGYLFLDEISLSQDSNLVFDFTGSKIHFISSNPNSYITGSLPVKDFISANNINDFIFRGGYFYNVGQTQSRVDTLDEGSYYSVLNDVAVTYNRRYNKTANSGAVFKCDNCTNITVENVNATQVGSLVQIQGLNSEFGKIVNNNVYDWGITAIYPGSNYEISGNKLIARNTPVLNSTDQQNDLGTSHAIYATTGRNNVNIHHNLIKCARISAVQFNTSTSLEGYGNSINNNSIDSTFIPIVIIGTNKIHVDISNNSIINSGQSLIDNSTATVNVFNNIFDGQYYETAKSAWSLTRAERILFSKNTFSGFEGSTSGGIEYFPASLSAILSITDNIFYSDNTFSIINKTANPSPFLSHISISKNRIYSTLSTCNLSTPFTSGNSQDSVIVSENIFYQKPASADAIFRTYEPVTLVNNEFYITSTSGWALQLNCNADADDMLVGGNNFYNAGSENAINMSIADIDNVKLYNNNFYGNLRFRNFDNTYTGADISSAFSDAQRNWQEIYSSVEFEDISVTGDYLGVTNPTGGTNTVQSSQNDIYEATQRITTSTANVDSSFTAIFTGTSSTEALISVAATTDSVTVTLPPPSAGLEGHKIKLFNFIASTNIVTYQILSGQFWSSGVNTTSYEAATDGRIDNLTCIYDPQSASYVWAVETNIP